MKLSRFRAIYNGMNSVAQKVYDAVPMSDYWHHNKITQELKRLGKQMDPAAVQGCLGYMLSMGLVKKNKDGEFIRTAITMSNQSVDETPPTNPTNEEITMATNPDVPKPPVPAPVSVFDILAALLKRCDSIADQIDDLKVDIEKAALQAQAEHEQNAGAAQKLQQFKQLFAALKD